SNISPPFFLANSASQKFSFEATFHNYSTLAETIWTELLRSPKGRKRVRQAKNSRSRKRAGFFLVEVYDFLIEMLSHNDRINLKAG
ncbi:MAG: hypothetical protein ABH858_04670, partial [Candidatus Omnitrophota bacterium]